VQQILGHLLDAYNVATNCLVVDGATTLTTEARDATRPYAGQCDIETYEFDGDYIFADGYETTL
jgi:hypothetical protein